MEKKRIETRERAAQEVFCVCELLMNFSLSSGNYCLYSTGKQKEPKMGQGVGLYYTSTVSLLFTDFALAFLFISIAVLCRGGLQPSSETHKALLPCIVRLKQPRPFFICKLRLDNLFFVNLFYYLTYFYYYL